MSHRTLMEDVKGRPLENSDRIPPEISGAQASHESDRVATPERGEMGRRGGVSLYRGDGYREQTARRRKLIAWTPEELNALHSSPDHLAMLLRLVLEIRKLHKVSASGGEGGVARDCVRAGGVNPEASDRIEPRCWPWMSWGWRRGHGRATVL